MSTATGAPCLVMTALPPARTCARTADVSRLSSVIETSSTAFRGGSTTTTSPNRLYLAVM
jgi:hypothetical protein